MADPPVVSSEQEVVTWAVQPMGMTKYITRNNQQYFVYKRNQQVTILKADHNELVERGLINV